MKATYRLLPKSSNVEPYEAAKRIAEPMPPNMQSRSIEADAVSRRHGKWSKRGVPHSGWYCVEIEDLGEPESICAMCESQEIRYVHHMAHKDYKDVLPCGCVCAGHMEGSLAAARTRDGVMHTRSRKRLRWLDRKWRVSKKGNDWIKADGYIVSVFPRDVAWASSVVSGDETFKQFSRRSYRTQNAAKLAAFDLITELLSKAAVEEADI